MQKNKIMVTLTHGSSFDFDAFDVEKFSKFGDFGEGVYFYDGEYCAYGICIGQIIYTASFSGIIKNISIDEWKEFKEFNIPFDAIKIDNCVIIKKQGIKKISIVEKSPIIDLIRNEWWVPIMFSCKNGKTYIL